ncbi:MAG: sulfotransferase [Acidimicrobiia bacterium]
MRGKNAGGRPAAVRIDDYAQPRFDADIAALRASVEPIAAELRLDSGALHADVTAELGVDDFGPPDYRERLDVLLDAWNRPGVLGAWGVVAQYTFAKQLLRNRALVQDLLVRNPEIHDVEIERPIIICGMPRTGTTHLHNLISADPGLRSLPYWESLEPVLPEAEQPAPGEPDPRLERTAFALEIVNRTMPLFKRMHEMTVEHVHEEIQLLAVDFSTMLFETTSYVPSWRDYYLTHDQTPHYRYLKTVLQALQWLRGGTHWVLKSPQHIEQFGPLRSVFPDATFVVTHRDPVSVTASLCTMIGYTARMNGDRIDPLEIGAYWSLRVQQMLQGCVAGHELLPPEQTVDVTFHDFMAGDIATVERIYAVAGRAFTADVRGAMDAFMADHPRGKFGTIEYDLSVFGVDPVERRAALRFYTDRFGTRDEDRW